MSRRIIILAITALLALSPAAHAAGWEEVVRQPPQSEHIEAEDVDVAVRDGYVYVSSPHGVQIKVFTILGQTVTQLTARPGIFRFKLPAKGIYILKIGSTTRRITV